tara:strand:- start:1437 stop:1748 length:312 start_codon:yes stop_codon:yes gene_type:complete
MALDHEAIYTAYKGVVTQIDDSIGARDASGNIVSIDQVKVDAARVELNKLNYQTDRTEHGSVTYDSWRNQLAMLYDDMVAGKLDTTGTWATHVKAVKDANPKP